MRAARNFGFADALARFQPKADIGLDFGRQPAPGDIRQFGQIRQELAHFVKPCDFFAAGRAAGHMPRGDPAPEVPQIAARM